MKPHPLGQAPGLPEAVCGVGLASAPVVQITREHEDCRVAVAEEGVQPPDTQLVPLGFLRLFNPVAVPRPVGLDQFRGGRPGQVGLGQRFLPRTGCDVLDGKPVPRPLHEVACAVVVETGLRHGRLALGEVFRMQHVAGVARAAVHFRSGRVFVQRPLVEVGDVLVVALVAGAKAKFPAARGPRRVDRERLEVVHVHHESQPDLLVIVQAGGGSPLLLRPGQSRQQQPGQYRDDGDHHQQLDQGKTKRRGMGTV